MFVVGPGMRVPQQLRAHPSSTLGIFEAPQNNALQLTKPPQAMELRS
jgi:hypothetical protein